METDREKYELNYKMIIKLQNENNEIINRMFKRISIDDTDYTYIMECGDYDDDVYISNDKDEKQGVHSYIKHIVKNDGITINGELHKWKKYNYGDACHIDLIELYKDYKKYTDEFNYKDKNYDNFIEALIYTYQGISKYVCEKRRLCIMSFVKGLADKLINYRE